jgi:hypothetical protein
VLWVTKVKLMPTVLLGQQAALALTKAQYGWTRVVMKNFTLNAGAVSYTIDNVSTGQLPKRMLFGYVDNEAFQGRYNKNPLSFNHNDLCSAAAYVSGRMFPSVAFAPDYQGGNWVREYHGLFDALGIRYGDRGFDISRKEYPNGYCIYGVDLTPNRGASDGSHVNLVKQGPLRLEVQFRVALAAAQTCVIYLEFDNLLEIDKDRNVYLDYTNK